MVELEIFPADLAWQPATLHQAEELLQKSQHQGCRVLRFLNLDTRAAAATMVRHYADLGECERDYEYGVLALPDHAQAARRMEEGILEPDVAIAANYLDTLAVLASLWSGAA